jgi:hypothetical protein
MAKNKTNSKEDINYLKCLAEHIWYMRLLPDPEVLYVGNPCASCHSVSMLGNQNIKECSEEMLALYIPIKLGTMSLSN